MTLYLLLSIATWLMLIGIIRYIPMRDNIGFLVFKKDYLHITIWKIAFYIHVFSVLFALLAGFTQFSDYFLKHNRALHKLIGRIYAYDILGVNFPAAMIMAIYANGLLPGKTAFVVLDFLWFWFTYKAVSEVKKGNIKLHNEYMMRSYALTLSAVTLRLWKTILSSFSHIDPVHLYMIDAWLGFVPNLLLAELLIRSASKKGTLTLDAEVVGNQ